MIRHAREITLPLPLVGALLHPFYRLTLNHRMPFRYQRVLLDGASLIQPLPVGTVVETVTLGTRPAERVTVGTPRGTDAVLYLHGGGYTVGSPRTHRSLAAFLARETGCAVYVPDYRLAPEHPFPAALDDAVAAFGDLVERFGHSAERIVCGGDSAGGGLAVATARRLIDDRGYRPAGLVLLSPWVDPEAAPDSERDLVINRKWARANADAYLGDNDPADPGYAPLRADLTGLPPTLVQIGVAELLHPQAIAFVAKLRADGVEVVFTEYERLWHDAQLQAALVRDANRAVIEIGRFVRTVLDSTGERSQSR